MKRNEGRKGEEKGVERFQKWHMNVLKEVINLSQSMEIMSGKVGDFVLLIFAQILWRKCLLVEQLEWNLYPFTGLFM